MKKKQKKAEISSFNKEALTGEEKIIVLQEKEKMATAFEKAKNNIGKILHKDWMIIMNDLHSNEH